ncbi:MAG: hypothetical protein ACOCUD_04435 [Bacillota bacterium]
MEREKFNSLYNKAFKNVFKEQELSFDEFMSRYNYFNSIEEDRNEQIKINNELLELCKIHSLKTGLFLLSIKEDDNNYAIFRGIFNTIANDILAVIKLALEGLEYQAYTVLRNLYEISLTLLVIMIDDKKKEEYFKSAKNENEYSVWRNSFSHKKLKETIESYEDSIDQNGNLRFLNKWRDKIYKEYSGFVHNDFFNILMYSVTHPKTNEDNEILNLTLWGKELSRTNKILTSMADLLFYTDNIFLKIIKDENIDFDKESFISKEKQSRNFWNEGLELTFILIEYYLEIKD